MTRRSNAEPHGTRDLIRYLIHTDPDTRRRYGRRFIRQYAARCPWCRAVDQRLARIGGIRTAYRRRTI